MEHDTKMEEDIKEIGLGLPDHNSPNKSARLMDCVAKIVFEECLKSIKTDLQNYTLTIASTLLENKFSYNWENIYNQLEKEALTEMVSSCKWNNAGRLGPPVVDINKKNEVGLLKVKENSLHISSSDNFSTVFGDVCVYKGKWQYEVMLDTKGVMQIGWATLNCKFSKENGVGDTPDSYAYDGSRQRKWNVSAQKYGEMWLCGDIITCLIDLDKGEIGYLRNGQPLGVAFNDLKLGNNMAYFPAMSLAIDESMVVNFGATPFHYPQLNFQALQCPPIKELIISKTCLLWLLRLVKINLNWHEYKECVKLEEENYGKKSIVLMLIAQHIGSALAPLLENPFVVESTLVPILDDLAQASFANDGKENQSHRQFALTFLDYLMLILQEEEMKVVASSLISCLQSYHKRVAQTIDCFSQKRSLKILSLVLSHTHFRKFCLKYVLFENYRFYSFTTINCIDKISLKNVPVPNINYYASKEGDFSHGDRNSYLDAVRVIESSAQELENLQIHFLRVLLTATDGKRYNETSRAIFLAKFRDFLKENFIDTSRTSFTIPNQDMLSLFHRCFYLFTLLWEEEVGLLGEGTIYPSMFYDGVLSYHDIQRLGGLLSHLQKTFHEEKEEALNKILKSKEKIQEVKDSGEIMDVDMISMPSTSGTVLGEPLLMTMQSMEVEMQRVDVTGFIANKQESNSAKNELRISLLHFLDGIILLYHHAGHKQVEKIIAQSDVIFDNVNHLEDFLIKKKKCLENVSSTAVIEELDCSIKVMETKLKEQSYQHAWNLATTLSNSSVLRLLRIWKLIYGVLKSSSTEKNLFAFVPEFYIETLTELSQDLRELLLCKNEVKKAKSKTKSVIKSRFFRPGGIEVPDFIIEEYESLLIKVGEFLSLHFCDNRIIYADSKDSLIQALAGFVCHKPSLEALEKMSEESQLLMVYSLLQPYENRAWAQNNWILVRFWKGKGFGFRFTKSPHLANKLGPKPAHCEIPNIVQSSVPSPSEVFLNHITNVLQNEEVSTPFLNSLLNQLNWVFSEFIGMLQEIQNASNRPERVFIDSRQLRICATCFDLALALLRVLEMVVSISIEIFVDQSRPNSQSMVTRLCQLMCQVLNRVSVGSGCFSHVVNLEIPGLETIHYFPILTSVTGILCQLLRYDVYRKEIKFAQVATSVLLSEASFQLAALYPLLGDQDTLVPLNQISLQPGSSSSYPSDALKEEPTEDNCTTLEGLFITPQCECKPPKFCFRKYPNDIKDFEIKKVVDLLHHLEKSSLALSSHGKLEDSDTFCTICYARFPDAKFEPCHHTSCVTCITHYLMNKTFCFFCKMPILEVVESTSNKTLWKAPDDPQLQKLDS